MALEDAPDTVEESRSLGWMDRLKGVMSTGADLMPVVGSLKIIAEGIRGVTADGFELNGFERAAYLGTITFRVISYVGIYDISQGEILDGAALVSACGVGSWICLAFGKARHTGRVFSVGEHVDDACRRVYFLLEPTADRLVQEE